MKLTKSSLHLILATTCVLATHSVWAQTDSSSSSGSGGGADPAGYSKCADASGACAVIKGSGMVIFGGNGQWVYKHVGVGKSIACTVAAFGSDPGGKPNMCFAQN